MGWTDIRAKVSDRFASAFLADSDADGLESEHTGASSAALQSKVIGQICAGKQLLARVPFVKLSDRKRKTQNPKFEARKQRKPQRRLPERKAWACLNIDKRS